MTGTLIGCARFSPDVQDLTAHRAALSGIGLAPDRRDVDYGLTGSGRSRPRRRPTFAACRADDT